MLLSNTTAVSQGCRTYNYNDLSLNQLTAESEKPRTYILAFLCTLHNRPITEAPTMFFAAQRLVIQRLVNSGSPARAFSSQSPSGQRPPSSPKKQHQSAAAAAPPQINENVPGLSARCVLPRSQPLGPGASPSGDYKVPEYFCYDKTSYAEAEIEMASFRCPQPNANRKL